jgi:protein TonB
MEFVFRKQSPASSAARISLVVALHVGLISALMAGLGHPIIHIPLPSSIEYVSVVETSPPAPKPEMKKTATPSPLQVPVPDVPIILPVVQTDMVSAVPNDTVVSTESSASTAAEGAGTTTAVAVSAACPNSQSVRSSMRYPIMARRDGLEGDVVARFVVGAAGGIRDAQIVSSSNRVFNSAVLSALQQFQCTGQGRDVMVEVPFSFRLQ